MPILNRSSYSDYALSVLRIVAGLFFISYGTMKMFGYPVSPVPFPPFSFSSQLGMAAVLEVFGGAAIVLGLLTRPIAFILSGEMAIAYFRMHAPQSFWPSVNNGMPAVLYCFLFLYLAFAGGGAWSVDRLLLASRHRRRATHSMRPSPAR